MAKKRDEPASVTFRRPGLEVAIDLVSDDDWELARTVLDILSRRHDPAPTTKEPELRDALDSIREQAAIWCEPPQEPTECCRYCSEPAKYEGLCAVHYEEALRPRAGGHPPAAPTAEEPKP